MRESKWKDIETSIPNTEVKTNDSIEEKRLKLIAEFDSRLNPSHAKHFKSSDSESELGSNHNISSRPNLGMVVIVYGSATLVYIQLMVLAAFLQTAVIPPGLVFLVSSLGYIWYVAFKVCLVSYDFFVIFPPFSVQNSEFCLINTFELFYTFRCAL